MSIYKDIELHPGGRPFVVGDKPRTYGELHAHTAAVADALAAANERLRAENLYLRREVEARYSFDGIIGDGMLPDEVAA